MHDEYLLGDPVVMNERLVISPTRGVFWPLPPETFTTEGEWVEEGQQLGEIRRGNTVVPIISPFRGWVMGMLVVPGQPVSQDDALFRIRP